MSWPTKTLVESCRLITDGTHYTPPSVQQGKPFLTVKDMHDGEVSFDECMFITDDEFCKADRGHSVPKKGDVLFSKDGTVGKVHVLKEDADYAILSSIAILRPNEKKLHSGYLGHLLSSPVVMRQATKNKTGSALRRIILKDLKSIKIPLPPLEEQKRIAAILDKADGIRRKRQQAIAMADEFLRSVFLDLFGDPVTNPKGWEVKRLDEVSESYDCPHSTPRWTAEGVLCIRTSNLANGDWDFSEKRFVSEKDYTSRSSRCEILPGDIILSREGTIGVAAMVEENMRLCLGQRLVQIRPKKNIILGAYLLQSILKLTSPEVVAGGMIGTTAQRINLKHLRSIEIPVPRHELQKQYEIIHKSTKRMLKRTTSEDQSEVLFSCLASNVF